MFFCMPAGFLYDATGTYDLAFYVAGTFITAAGVICLPLRMFRRCDGGATADAIQLYEKELAMKAEDTKIKESKMAACEDIAAMETQQTTGSNLNLYTRGIMGGEMGKAAFSHSMESLRKELDHGSVGNLSRVSLKAHGSISNVSQASLKALGSGGNVSKALSNSNMRCKTCNSKCTCEVRSSLLEQQVASV